MKQVNPRMLRSSIIGVVSFFVLIATAIVLDVAWWTISGLDVLSVDIQLVNKDVWIAFESKLQSPSYFSTLEVNVSPFDL